MATGVGDFFRKLLPQDSASPTEPAVRSSSKPLSIAEIKTEAESLSAMLKAFYSGSGYMSELEWFQLLINGLPRAFHLLAIELNAFVQPSVSASYAYSKPVPAKGDAGWLSRLEKAQKDVARAAVAAVLFKELFRAARVVRPGA